MNPIWAVRLPASQIAAAGTLRLTPGAHVLLCDDEQELWLAGETMDDALGLQLAILPEARQYAVLPDGQLILEGRRVPSGFLRQGDWQKSVDWLEPELPHAALSGDAPPAVPLRIVRGGAANAANVLLTTTHAWLLYAAAAPAVRLKQWAFAQSDEDAVVVRGAPLPPIPGVRFVEQHGVAIEVGFRCDPPVDAVIVRDVLAVPDGDLALLHQGGRCDRIAAEYFVQATRSAVRLSAGAADD